MVVPQLVLLSRQAEVLKPPKPLIAGKAEKKCFLVNETYGVGK